MRLALAALLSGAACTASAGTFASTVVSYSPGAAPGPNTDAAAALGSPTRFTGTQFGFPGAVTPFNPSFDPGETVGIGFGGQLTVRFDQPVQNDPLNPYGVDLLIFGNSFFFDPVNFSPTALALSAEAATVEVSQDGLAWFTVTGGQADGLFPTLGYSDQTDPFGGPAGLIETDFAVPVNPALAWQGLSAAQIFAAYNGPFGHSGGGAGIDLDPLGLAWVQYVRVSGTVAGSSPDIDAFSDVRAIPSPGGLAALAVAALTASRRRTGRGAHA